MTKIKFRGVAPIPAGTVVRMHVNDTSSPTTAFSIEDTKRRIHFTEREPAAKLAGEAGYVEARIQAATVYAGDNRTDLEVSDIKPAESVEIAPAKKKGRRKQGPFPPRISNADPGRSRIELKRIVEPGAPRSRRGSSENS